MRPLTLSWLSAVAVLAACSRHAPPPAPVRAVRTLPWARKPRVAASTTRARCAPAPSRASPSASAG